jgi:UDP-glucose 4-epimerase
MTKVLVTGVAGFIGSHVADACLAEGFHVVGADDLSGGSKENVPGGVVFRQGTLVDPAFCRALWSDGPFDHVYHLAAYAAEGLSHFIRRFNYTTNLLASVNLINEAVRNEVKCFVFTSSIAVYGHTRPPVTESDRPAPADPYGISKYATELDLESAADMFGLDYIVFRPHNVFGERQNIADRYRNVVGIFMNQALKGEPLTVFGDGKQTRAFTYISDVAPVIAHAPLVPAAYRQVFNIGSDQHIDIATLAADVSEVMGVEPQLKFLPARNEVMHAYARHDKMQRFFGLTEGVELRVGLQRMADWVKKHGPAERTRFGDLEITRGLPDAWCY